MTGWRNLHSNPPTDSGDRKRCRELAESPSKLPPNAHAEDTIQGIRICASQYGDTKALAHHRKILHLSAGLKIITGFPLVFDPIAGASPGIKDRGEVIQPLLYCNAASLTFAVRQGRISFARPQFGCRATNAEAPASSR